jgi:hypothetical protein
MGSLDALLSANAADAKLTNKRALWQRRFNAFSAGVLLYIHRRIYLVKRFRPLCERSACDVFVSSPCYMQRYCCIPPETLLAQLD